jgi:hypothetical protein
VDRRVGGWCLAEDLVGDVVERIGQFDAEFVEGGIGDRVEPGGDSDRL